MSLTLVIGNKTYSSWSLRAALAMELAGAEYREELIALNRPDSRTRILQHSPTGKVPLLLSEDGAIWDSLAIAEYLAECFPAAQLWPQARAARALARSACAEMHSGFVALRSHLPMDLKRNQGLAAIPADAEADIQRICALWAECRQRFGQDGPYLFGQPSLADAFFAPVAARLRSYQVALPAAAAAYVETIYQWPAFQRWYQAAQEEQLA
ncbi:MAG: glutathione S-transferase family protein [Gammaproteobacteria bacterium]|jgi:glutathione S-transferase|nr:glutathione S-transferase family protein [Gammaproteobacteria bacterium]MBU1491288.1 glutathione S-transferase family protein [Gammaproteobacteria bacterium]MBU2066615.1 glutathione S-transferase family protein [Gammaproteobacteria bacterium]MBU2140658.1 glutathione S-transferase family protein [Gammaproteobacteria bacterium]MBU2218648.1 glutathione S-transferase family protein [Gammaproteobacteria bacterium]